MESKELSFILKKKITQMIDQIKNVIKIQFYGLRSIAADSVSRNLCDAWNLNTILLE